MLGGIGSRAGERPPQVAAMDRFFDELKLVQTNPSASYKSDDDNVRIALHKEPVDKLAPRVLNRRCETAAAASFLLTAAIESFQSIPKQHSLSGGPSGDIGTSSAHFPLEAEFSGRLHDAIFKMEEAGLLHDRKVRARIERSVEHLKVAIGLASPPKASRFQFFKGALAPKERQASAQGQQSRESKSGDSNTDGPGTKPSVTIETAGVETISHSIEVASLEKLKKSLVEAIGTGAERLYANHVSETVSRAPSPLAVIRSGVGDTCSTLLSKLRNASPLYLAPRPAEPLTADKLSAPVSAPQIKDFPIAPVSRHLNGDKLAAPDMSVLFMNQACFGNPLGDMTNDFLAIQSRMRACTELQDYVDTRGSTLRKIEAYQLWHGVEELDKRYQAQVPLDERESIAFYSPDQHLTHLVSCLRQVGRGKLNYAPYVLAYLRKLDTNTLRWLAHNMFNDFSGGKLGVPTMHASDCLTLHEALFCEGHDRPECIQFFKELQKAFLLAIPRVSLTDAGESEQIQRYLSGLVDGRKFKNQQGALLLSLKDKWNAFVQARAAADQKLSLELQTRPPFPLSTSPSGLIPASADPRKQETQKEQFEKIYGGMLLVLQFHLEAYLLPVRDIEGKRSGGNRGDSTVSVDERVSQLREYAGVGASVVDQCGGSAVEKEIDALESAIRDGDTELDTLTRHQAKLIDRLLNLEYKALAKVKKSERNARIRSESVKWPVGRSAAVLVGTSPSASDAVAASDSRNPSASALKGIDNFSFENPDHVEIFEQFVMNEGVVQEKMEDWLDGLGQGNISFSGVEFGKLLHAVSQEMSACFAGDRAVFFGECVFTLANLIQQKASFQRRVNDEFRAGSVHVNSDEGGFTLYIQEEKKED